MRACTVRSEGQNNICSSMLATRSDLLCSCMARLQADAVARVSQLQTQEAQAKARAESQAAVWQANEQALSQQLQRAGQEAAALRQRVAYLARQVEVQEEQLQEARAAAAAAAASAAASAAAASGQGPPGAPTAPNHAAAGVAVAPTATAVATTLPMAAASVPLPMAAVPLAEAEATSSTALPYPERPHQTALAAGQAALPPVTWPPEAGTPANAEVDAVRVERLAMAARSSALDAQASELQARARHVQQRAAELDSRQAQLDASAAAARQAALLAAKEQDGAAAALRADLEAQGQVLALRSRELQLRSEVCASVGGGWAGRAFAHAWPSALQGGPSAG